MFSCAASRGEIFNRSLHHLEDLAKDCARFEKKFLVFLDECRILTRYYIETRYPALVPINYPIAEAKKAIDMAEEISGFVISLLKR